MADYLATYANGGTRWLRNCASLEQAEFRAARANWYQPVVSLVRYDIDTARLSFPPPRAR